MWNILRSQIYQTKRDNFTIYVIIIIMAVSLGSLFMDGFADMTGAAYMTDELGENFLLILIANLFFVTRISGWDYNDKTINYELMTGHSKAEVYWGRVACSILWSCLGCFVIMIIPILLATLFNGWGNTLDFGNAILRLALTLFPLFRFTCLYVMTTTLLKNSSKGLLIGWLEFETVLIGCSLVEELMDVEMTTQFAYTNSMSLLMFTNAREQLIDGKAVYVSESAIEPSVIAGTIIVSLTVGILYLLIGYRHFKKSDRD